MIRVIFVDDEPNVLDGLRRMLRSKRKEWDMDFALGGAEALALMAENPCQVVVSDMKMPGMDGVTLLSHVKREYPGTIRIVLSGQSSRDEVLKAVSPAHQFLSKPCEAEQLVGTIGQAIQLRSELSDPDLMALVARVETLPVLPGLYEALTEELNRPDPRLDVLGELIDGDPAMTANILKLVNSAFFGLRREVSEVRQAISFLGIDTISALVLSEGIFRQFDAATFEALSLQAVSNHSVRTAGLAQALAAHDEVDKSVVQHAFTAGMVHNIGKLVLASDFPREYVAAAADREAGDEGIAAWEGAIGAYLLTLWGLPDPIVEAVAHAARPSAFTGPDPGALPYVHVASRIAGRPATVTPVAEPSSDDLDLDFLARVGLRDRVQEWESVAARMAEPAEA